MVFQLPILIINQNFLKCWVNDSNFLYSLKKNVNSTNKVSYWLLSNKKFEFNLNIHQKSIGILLDITSNHLKVDFIGLKYYFILKKKKRKKKKQVSIPTWQQSWISWHPCLSNSILVWKRLFLLVLGCKNKEAQFISFGTVPIRDVSPKLALV